MSGTIPPAGSLQVLASDLLYLRAVELLRLCAWGNFDAADRLRDACEAYSEIRQVNVVKAAAGPALPAAEADPQCMQLNDKAPITQRSVHRG